MRIALIDGYIPTRGILEMTGVTYRKLHYWENKGVFGQSVRAGSGQILMWDSKLVKAILILREISEEMGEFNAVSVELLKRIIENYDEGGIQFSESTRLTWDVQ
jgi:DNA-binding transcriptional MerR regulator